LKWTLVGESSKLVSASSGRRENKVIIQNPKVEIYEEGKVSLTLTGKTGTLIALGVKKITCISTVRWSVSTKMERSIQKNSIGEIKMEHFTHRLK
jgi:hypothetical protein